MIMKPRYYMIQNDNNARSWTSPIMYKVYGNKVYEKFLLDPTDTFTLERVTIKELYANYPDLIKELTEEEFFLEFI